MALATDKQIRYIEILVEQVPGAEFPQIDPLTKKDASSVITALKAAKDYGLKTVKNKDYGWLANTDEGDDEEFLLGQLRHTQQLQAVAAQTRDARAMGELLEIAETLERRIDEVRAAK